jgi:hypothetical protein
MVAQLTSTLFRRHWVLDTDILSDSALLSAAMEVSDHDATIPVEPFPLGKVWPSFTFTVPPPPHAPGWHVGQAGQKVCGRVPHRGGTHRAGVHNSPCHDLRDVSHPCHVCVRRVPGGATLVPHVRGCGENDGAAWEGYVLPCHTTRTRVPYFPTHLHHHHTLAHLTRAHAASRAMVCPTGTTPARPHLHIPLACCVRGCFPDGHW